MPAFLRRNATPLTAALFLITLVTGLMLLPQTPAQSTRAIHAWASVLLILPVALHAHKNWRGLQGYWRKLRRAGR